MRSFFVLMLFLMIKVTSVSAQRISNYSSSMEISGGYIGEGYGFTAGFNYYMNKWTYYQGSVFLGFSEEDFKGITIPYNNFNINLTYNRNVWFNRRKELSLSLGGGPTLGWEIVNNGNNELSNGAIITSSSSFIWGVIAQSEFQYVINNKFTAFLKLNQSYHISSDLGQLQPYTGVGFKYDFF